MNIVYTMITEAGQTVHLTDHDIQNLRRYFRHEEWRAQILNKLDEDCDCVILTEREKENFLSECMADADNKYEIYGEEPINIMDVYNSVVEDWGMF